MRKAWHHHPTLIFLASLDNDIVAIGGWVVLPDVRPANDRHFTTSLP